MNIKLKIMFAFLLACCINIAPPELPLEVKAFSEVVLTEIELNTTQIASSFDVALKHFKKADFNSELIELYNRILSNAQNQVAPNQDLRACYRALKPDVSREEFLNTMENMLRTYEGFCSSSRQLLDTISKQNKGGEAYNYLLNYCMRFNPDLKYDTYFNQNIAHIFPEGVPYNSDWTFGDIIDDLEQKLELRPRNTMLTSIRGFFARLASHVCRH